MKTIIILLLVAVIATFCSAKHHHKVKSIKKSSQTNGSKNADTRETIIMNPSLENAGKRTIYESLQDQFPTEMRKKAAKAFRDVISTMLEGPTDDGAFDEAGESLVKVLEIFHRTGGEIFKQLRKKLEIKPKEFYQNIVNQNVDDIKEIIESKKVTKSQWVVLKDNKYRFMPASKHYASTEYTRDFFSDIIAYSIIFTAATIDLVFKGDVYECNLSKELDLFKNDVETSVQVLIYKRLKMLEPHSSDWRWVDLTINGHDTINYKDTYKKELLCKNGCELFRDGKEPVSQRFREISQSVLDDASPMFEFLDKFLALLSSTKAFCFKGCLCPPEEEAIKMERSKYVKELPWGCLGKPKDEKKDCKLRCGKYGQTYDWCPTEMTARANAWSKCKPANFDTCIQGWYKK